MIKTVLVDDHKLILSGLEKMLSAHSDISIAAAFTDAALGLEFVLQNDVDLLVTDLDMPGTTGIELIKKIRKRKSHQKIIVLSMIDERSIVNRMIKYEVNGYLMKNEAQAELADAIRKVYHGDVYFNKEIRSLLFKNPEQKKISTNRIPRLSAREKEILKLIINEKTTGEIAQILFISEGTVVTHRKHILAKLGVKNTAGMVRKALELGLVD